MDIDYFFSSPIGGYKIEVDDLTDYVLQLSESKSGVSRSNLGGWHSDDFRNPEPQFEILWNNIDTFVNQFHESMGLMGNVYISSLWFNVNSFGSSNAPHVHPNSIWSGVYYIKTPEECGCLGFQNPNVVNNWVFPQKIMTEKSDKMFKNNIIMTPEKNVLYIFPGWLSHFVDANMSQEKRISLSFNTKLIT
tara:strand:+ start:263 stop:835 length:573 start_codon:yes stop_codon:yes gene_type:complete